MSAFDFGAAVVWSAFILFLLLTGFAYTTFMERKVVARMQARVGPNRAGPFGLLQPLADGIKLVFKENITPLGVDTFIYFLAPMISLVVAIMAFAVIPMADPVDVSLFGIEGTFHFQLIDPNIGLLYLLGVGSLAVYGIVLAGWSSNNKYALLGGMRSSAQMVSYELALGISLLGVVLLAGTLRMSEFVAAQSSVWFVILQPLGFILYAFAAVAETNRAPFDMPEAEQELIAGYHTEYTGMRFALFFMAEYIHMITVSAVAAVLFLGGYTLPFIDGLPWFLDLLVILAKIFLCLFFFIWLRATLPRLRYDRLMDLGWKVLLPLSIFNLAITAVLLYWWQARG